MNSPKYALDTYLNKTALLHILCWVIFICYELGMVYYIVGNIEKPYIYIIYYFIHIVFFYAHINLLTFAFGSTVPKYIKGALGFLAFTSSYLILITVADYFTFDQHNLIRNPYIYFKGFFLKNLFRGLYFDVLATFFWSAGNISYFRRQASKAERQQLLIQMENAALTNKLTISKNAYLQQQINPHMLFNALNFVYSTTQRYSDDAANCIWLLSEIMRFSLDGTDADGKVSLAKETEQIENLFEINRYRYQQPFNVSLETEGDCNSFRIIPLILITLTENVFKHGNLLDEDHPAKIIIKIDDEGKLIYRSHNAKKTKTDFKRSRQLGLETTKIRLDTAYAHNYHLDISESEKFYDLTLTIKL